MLPKVHVNMGQPPSMMSFVNLSACWCDGRTMTRKEKFAQLAKGFQGRHKNVKKLQILAVQRALQYQTRDRRKKKRYHRSLWAQQIGGGTKEHGVSYATFVNHLAEAKIMLNRKILAELAQYEPLTFRAIVEEVCEMELCFVLSEAVGVHLESGESRDF